MQFGHRERSHLLSHDNEEKLQQCVHTPANERGRRTDARIPARFKEPTGTDRPKFWVFQKSGVPLICTEPSGVRCIGCSGRVGSPKTQSKPTQESEIQLDARSPTSLKPVPIRILTMVSVLADRLCAIIHAILVTPREITRNRLTPETKTRTGDSHEVTIFTTVSTVKRDVTLRN